MSPLLERHVLASEFDNFLSNESTEHGSLGSDRAGTVGSNLLDNVLVNFIDTDAFSLLESSINHLDIGDNLGKIFLGILRISSFLLLEQMNTTKGKMENLRSSHTEVVHIKRLEHTEFSAHAGVRGCLLERLEFDARRYFSVLNSTLASVLTKVACVDLDLEAVSSAVKDLDGASIIELDHTLNLSKFDEISILVRVALIFVNHDLWVLLLLDSNNNELLGSFTVLISDHEVGTVVKEGIRGKTHVLTLNISNVVASAESIDLLASISSPEHLSD